MRVPPPSPPTKIRHVHVDLARGLSILLVAFHHSELARLMPQVSEFFGIVRMPLFFLLAGVFLNVSVRPASFVGAKAKALLWPYTFTALAYCTVLWLWGVPDVGWYLRHAAFGNGHKLYWPQMWFLVHLFMAVVVAYAVLRRGWLQAWPQPLALTVLALGAWGATLVLDSFWGLALAWGGRQITLPGLPASVDLLPYTAIFVMAGYLLRRQIEQLRWRPTWCAALLVAWLLIYVGTDASIDLNRRQHVGGLLTLLATLAAIAAVLLVAKRLSMSPRLRGVQAFLIQAGQSSLLILVFHLPIMRLLDPLLASLAPGVPAGLLAMLSLSLSVVLPLWVQPLAARSALLRSVYQLRRPAEQLSARP